MVGVSVWEVSVGVSIEVLVGCREGVGGGSQWRVFVEASVFLGRNQGGSVVREWGSGNDI